jgi:hypothetical protein
MDVIAMFKAGCTPRQLETATELRLLWTALQRSKTRAVTWRSGNSTETKLGASVSFICGFL